MKPKILIFGDSQAASLIKAIKENAEELPFVPFYFVYPGLVPSDFQINAGQLEMQTSKKQNFVSKLNNSALAKIDKFQHIFICSNLLRMSSIIANSFENHRLYHADLQPDTLAEEHQHLLTLPALKMLIEERVQNSPLHKIAQKLRAQSAAPITIFQVCNFAKNAINELEKARYLEELCSLGYAKKIHEIFSHARDEIFTELPKTRVIEQDPRTVSDVFFTEEIYTRNAHRLINLKSKQPKNDFIHTNITYGRMLLEKLTDCVNHL